MLSYSEKINKKKIFNIYKFLCIKFYYLFIVLNISSASFELNSLAANSVK